jgi:hypothetical protein
VGRLSQGVEAGFEGGAGGAAVEPVEGADVNEGDFHRRGAVVVFGEAQGLGVHRADGAEGDRDAVFAGVLVDGGVDRALDAAAAPLGMDEIAVTNGLAGADDPGDAEVEFDGATREGDPTVAGRFGGGVGHGDCIPALEAILRFFARDFAERGYLGQGLVEVAAVAGADLRFDFFFRVGLGDLRGNIGGKDSVDVPVDNRAQDVARAQQQKDPKTAPAQDFASPAPQAGGPAVHFRG